MVIETHRRRHLAYLMADQGALVGNPEAAPNLPKQHLSRTLEEGIRQVKKSRSMIQLLLFGEETSEEDFKSKNIKQTETPSPFPQVTTSQSFQTALNGPRTEEPTAREQSTLMDCDNILSAFFAQPLHNDLLCRAPSLVRGHLTSTPVKTGADTLSPTALDGSTRGVGTQGKRGEGEWANHAAREILVDLREAVLQVARHFMSVDPKLSKVVLVPDYSMESHSLDQDNYINVSRNRKRRAKALLGEQFDTVYIKQLVQRTVCLMDAEKGVQLKMDILQAIRFIVSAWHHMSHSSIRTVLHIVAITADMNFAYVYVDQELATFGVLCVEEICDGLRSESFWEEGQDGGEDDNEVELEPVVSLIGALRAFKTMRSFVYGHNITERDFERHDDDELGFRKNDIITIVSQKDEHCWVGELNGLRGWFPAKFVELLDERSKQYSCAGDDSVSEAVTDLVRGILCPAVKQVLEHGMKKPNILGGPCHPWLFIEEAATKEVERDFNSVYSRLVLCKTYRLDEDGKVLTPEELMYRCVQAVNQTHDDAHSQMDVKMRSLICLGLNEQVLHLWLEVLCSYYPWSFLNSPGWVQIKCELRVLSQFAFNLNPDWELPPKKEQSQPLKDGVWVIVEFQLVEKVVLHISHSSLMSSDRMKPRSRDWAIKKESIDLVLQTIGENKLCTDHQNQSDTMMICTGVSSSEKKSSSLSSSPSIAIVSPSSERVAFLRHWECLVFFNDSSLKRKKPFPVTNTTVIWSEGVMEPMLSLNMRAPLNKSTSVIFPPLWCHAETTDFSQRSIESKSMIFSKSLRRCSKKPVIGRCFVLKREDPLKNFSKGVKANNRIFKYGEALIEPGLAGAIEPICLVSPREVCVLNGFSQYFVWFREGAVRLSSFRAMSEITALDPVVNVDIDKKRPLVEESQIGEEAKRARVEIERVKKRKVAMLLCYSGQGYLGMQRNPGMQTIEEELINSMLKADLISEEAFTTPQQMQFQRAARTDKGVSAARQVVSLKLPEKAKVEEINEHLPEQIRALGIKRTTKGFNSKSSCDARTYSYMLPTFSFTPPEQEISEAFRVTPEILEEVRTTLKIFEGTHNFHNFTSRKKPLDPSANRYIMSFCCEEPFLCGDIEFVVLKVKGQSFMLHQIRKMVGVVIAVVRGLTTKETIIRAWNTDRLDIPVAPGLGLVLEEVHYDRYNQKFGKDGIHEVLSWQEFDKDVKDFKENL
uniref:Pseudouridylate synthase 1 homolog n=1 Tax=Timema shepardi TaxID=629360 RepID=A0A7R9AT95_TIMSH|nr:unnamed protein product [Timema shepardi]